MPPRLDFKQLAQDVDIMEVAQHVGLRTFRKGDDVRARCPACESNSDRSLQLFEETNSFRCHAAELSGDCIALLAHAKGYTGMYRAAKEISEQFGATASTAPQKTEGRTARAQPAPPKPFDPVAFAKNLTYSDEVETLGIDEGTATALAIGWHPKRKLCYFPIRNLDGSIAGFIGLKNPDAVKLPPQWLLQHSNVIPLKRGA